MELLENGLDELASAVENLATSPTPRALKRAVTDLPGGVELVLKERLRRHDWRQLFDDVAVANEGDLLRGDFISPTSDQVLRRLRDPSVELSNRKREVLSVLSPDTAASSSSTPSRNRRAATSIPAWLTTSSDASGGRGARGR